LLTVAKKSIQSSLLCPYYSVQKSLHMTLMPKCNTE
jgi:hypothetical protein